MAPKHQKTQTGKSCHSSACRIACLYSRITCCITQTLPYAWLAQSLGKSSGLEDHSHSNHFRKESLRFVLFKYLLFSGERISFNTKATSLACSTEALVPPGSHSALAPQNRAGLKISVATLLENCVSGEASMFASAPSTDLTTFQGHPDLPGSSSPQQWVAPPSPHRADGSGPGLLASEAVG